MEGVFTHGVLFSTFGFGDYYGSAIEDGFVQLLDSHVNCLPEFELHIAERLNASRIYISNHSHFLDWHINRLKMLSNFFFCTGEG